MNNKNHFLRRQHQQPPDKIQANQKHTHLQTHRTRLATIYNLLAQPLQCRAPPHISHPTLPLTSCGIAPYTHANNQHHTCIQPISHPIPNKRFPNPINVQHTAMGGFASNKHTHTLTLTHTASTYRLPIHLQPPFASDAVPYFTKSTTK